MYPNVMLFPYRNSSQTGKAKAFWCATFSDWTFFFAKNHYSGTMMVLLNLFITLGTETPSMLTQSTGTTWLSYLRFGAETKIDELEMTVLVNEDILRLQVPVSISFKAGKYSDIQIFR